MPGQSPPTRQRPFPKRILAYPAHATLSALMSLAVVLLERRIRKALRSGNGDRAADPVVRSA